MTNEVCILLMSISQKCHNGVKKIFCQKKRKKNALEITVSCFCSISTFIWPQLSLRAPKRSRKGCCCLVAALLCVHDKVILVQALLIEKSYPRNILQDVNWHPWNWMWHPKWHLLGRKLDRCPAREITTSIDALPKARVLKQYLSSHSLHSCSWPLSLTVSPNWPKLFWLKLLGKWASRWRIFIIFLF